MAIYLFSSAGIMAAGAIAGVLIFPQYPLNYLALWLALTLIQITLVTLILGIANILTPLSLLLGSFASITILLSLTILYRERFQRSIRSVGSSYTALNSKGRMVTLTLLSTLVISCVGFLSHLYAQVTLVHPLSWDVVTYHLPNAVGYLQSKGLWKLTTPFSHYPGGNELLNLWSLVPLRQDNSLGLTTLSLNLGVLLNALLLLRDTHAWRYGFSLALSFFLFLGVYFSFGEMQLLLFDIGRNDITLGYWVLLGFWTWLRFTQTETTFYRKFWLFWSGVSFGCALGVKPNGVYPILGLFLLILIQEIATYIKNHNRFALLKHLIDIGLIWLLPIALISGFWYLRNYQLLGTVFERQNLEIGTQMALVWHLTNPNLYTAPRGAIFLLSLLTTATLIACLLKGQIKSKSMRYLFYLNIISFCAWLLTPYSAGYYAGEVSYFHPQLRHAVSYIVTLSILIVYGIRYLFLDALHHFSPQVIEGIDCIFNSLHHSHNLSFQQSFRIAIVSLGLSFSLLVAQTLNYQPPKGLPSYSKILFYPHSVIYESGVYEWIQENVRNKRILNINLRSYGLFNFPFSNTVIEGSLPTSELSNPRSSEGYDYIALALDPFTATLSEDLKAFLQNPKGYRVVYADPLALVLAKE